jgi:hypothetical protein
MQAHGDAVQAGLVQALVRQNRILKALLATLAVGGGALLLSAFSSDGRPTRFTEIDVERINIVGADGKKALVIANAERIPDPVTDGVVFKRSGPKRPGLIFYNSVGDENGGLIFDGKLDEKGHPNSGMHFSMDRFGGDQQLALGHYESGGSMESGLNVYDRAPRKAVETLRQAYDKAAPGPERQAALQQLKDAGGMQTKRMFVGKTRGQSSAVILADANGRARITMVVTPDGKATLDFLDENGKVVQRLPQVASAN